MASDELEFNNAPNLVTAARIALVPAVVVMMSMQTPGWDFLAALVFAIASASDWLDGYLARRLNKITVYGKLMDPLADKFLVVATLIMLQQSGRIHPIVVILLVCRELAITGLRALASAEGMVIAASGGGKWKTAIQMIALPFIMLDAGPAVKSGALRTLPILEPLPIYTLGMVLLYLSLTMSLWSAKDYVVDFLKALKVRAEQRKKARLEKRALKIARREAKRLERAALKAKRGRP
jgi:CDP-diacylglycerol--glycerol-3-phosphate 3-phosphatidyltransferase